MAGAARGLGVAPATLRSWERRYGLAPSLHTKGGHRRYGPEDLARLAVMNRLVRDGVPPAEAARVAIRTHIDLDQPDQSGPVHPFVGLVEPGAGAVPSPPSAEATGAEAPVRPAQTEAAGVAAPGGAGPATDAAAATHDGSAYGAPGGGRVLRMPRRPPSARGLARAAMALDSHSCQRTVQASLADRGAIATWEELVRPVMAAIGERWADTGRGVEVEHSFSAVVSGAMAAHAARLARPRNSRPVLLASVPDELHDLPLVALHAALADVGIRSHVVGARTPQVALDDAITRLGPPVVFLWSQMGTPAVPSVPAVRPAPVVVVGGPGWQALPDEVVVTGDLASAVGAVSAAMGL